MKVFLALLAVAAVAALPVAALGAADPPPTPCQGTLITDPKGDQSADPVPLVNVPAAASPTEDLTDIRNVFFNMKKGADGKDVLTANIVVTNLTKDIPEASLDDGVSWTVHFTDPNGDALLAQAHNDGGTISYRYQEVHPLPGDALGEFVMVDTTGSFNEGPMGVVSIVMAPSLAKEGTKLTAVFARVSVTSEREEEVTYSTADRAPDAAADNKTYTVTACPPEQAAPAAGGDPAPAPPADQPQPQPQPAQPQPQPQPAAPARVATGLQFTVKPGRDARPPFVFRTIGKLTPPSSVSRKDACQGRVSVQVKSGKKTVSVRRVSVRPDCTFVQRLRIANRKRVGKARSLRYVVTFQGNKFLLPQKAKARTVRIR